MNDSCPLLTELQGFLSESWCPTFPSSQVKLLQLYIQFLLLSKPTFKLVELEQPMRTKRRRIPKV